MKPLYPVKFVEWREVVEWTWKLSEKIEQSSFIPDIIVAVGRGGLVVSRLLCDFLDVEAALILPIKWIEPARRPGEKYLADLVRGWVKAVREDKSTDESVEEVVKSLRTEIKIGFNVDLSSKKALLVEEIVATGMHMSMAKEYAYRRWRVKDLRTATLVWKSSTAPFFKPDYYIVEPRGFVWFQFPWSRLNDYKQFLRAMLSDFSNKGKRTCTIEEVKSEFAVWYGSKIDFSYLKKALDALAKEKAIRFIDEETVEIVMLG